MASVGSEGLLDPTRAQLQSGLDDGGRPKNRGSKYLQFSLSVGFFGTETETVYF